MSQPERPGQTIVPSTTSGISDAQLRSAPVWMYGSVTGPLTDVQLRATPVPVSGTFWPATQPVSGTVAVTGTFWPATQPVSIAATVAVSGPLTDTQLRATPVPVSGTVAVSGSVNVTNGLDVDVLTLPALPAGSNAIGSVTVSNFPASQAVTGQFYPATQPVSGPVTDAQLRASALPVSGTFFQATQPVSIAATVAVSGPVTDAQLRAAAVPVSLATLPALAAGSATIGTTLGPALTKATQGATGYSTQDLKDAGRVIVNAATAIAGVACVTTEALLSLNVGRDAAAAAATTTIAVTAGKRLRVTGMICSSRSTGATVLSARVALRMNPSGVVTATSPIIAIASMTQQAAALAEAGDTCVVMFPDGIEFSGAMQIGLSQVCSAATGVIYASLIGFEY